MTSHVKVSGRAITGPIKYLVIAAVILTAPIWMLLVGIAILAAGIAYSVIWVASALTKGANNG